MLITEVLEIQTVSHIWVFRITPVHLYAETTIWTHKRSFQMRMSLPNREKHIQVKCQIQLCRISVLVHTAFREAAQSWNTEKESRIRCTALKEAIRRYFSILQTMIIDYAVLWFSDTSPSLTGIRFMKAVAFSAACSVCHRCLGKGKHLLLNAWWCREQDGWTDHEIVLGQSYAATSKHSKLKPQVASFCLFSSALTAKIHFFKVWGFFIPTWNLRFSQN